MRRGIGDRFLSVGANPAVGIIGLTYIVPAGAGRMHVKLVVHDVAGRIMRTLVNTGMRAGQHQVVWHGKDRTGAAVPAGLYFSRLVLGGQTTTKRLQLVR